METARISQLNGRWKWLMSYAIILMIVGVFALANPLAAALATSMILAISLLVSGGFSLVTGIAAKGAAGRWIDIVFGILAIIGGVIVLRAPIEGAVAIVWALGALYAVSGLFELAAAFRVEGNRGWLIALGVIDVILGFWIMFMLPAAAILILAFIVGLGLLIRGAILFWVSLRIRKITG